MRDEQEIAANLAEDAEIVREIERRVGRWPWEFKNLQAVPTSETEVAAIVLPILAARLSAGARPATRFCIYQKMSTRHAGSYVDLLLGQLPNEPYKSDEMNILMPAIVHAASDADIPRVWSALREMRGGSFRWWEAAGMIANRRTAPAEIGAVLRQALDEGNHRFYVYQYMSTVRDRRVRDWFAGQQNSEDKDLARLARRVAGKNIKPPPGVVVHPSSSDRELGASSFELSPGEIVESTEMDLEEAPRYFREWMSSLGLKLPRWLHSSRGLEFLDVDQWASIDLQSKSGTVYTLSLRLEDFDVIEILLTRQATETVSPVD